MNKNSLVIRALCKSKYALLSAFTALLYLMSFSSALAGSHPGTAAARSFVATLNRVILLPLIGLLMGVAFFVFIWGCFEYIRGANNPTAREAGVKHITYGVIGLVVMISAYTILSLAANTFGLTV